MQLGRLLSCQVRRFRRLPARDVFEERLISRFSRRWAVADRTPAPHDLFSTQPMATRHITSNVYSKQIDCFSFRTLRLTPNPSQNLTCSFYVLDYLLILSLSPVQGMGHATKSSIAAYLKSIINNPRWHIDQTGRFSSPNFFIKIHFHPGKNSIF